MLSCQDPSKDSVKEQIAYFNLAHNYSRYSILLYVYLSIFMTPFSDRFFLTFIWSSILFAIEVICNNKFFDGE